jgi:hypothetical protein
VLAFIAGLKESSIAGPTSLSSLVHARRRKEKRSATRLRESIFIVNGYKPLFILVGEWAAVKKAPYSSL